jgi:cell division transport system permease protein
MSLRQLEFQVVETSTNIKRNGLMTMAAVTNAAACLFVLGAFGMGMWNLQRLTSRLAEEARVLVFLRDTAEVADANDLLAQIKAKLPGLVREAEVIDRQHVTEAFERDTGVPVGRLAGEQGPFPNSIRLSLSQPERWGEVVAIAKADRRVDEVRTGREIFEPIIKLQRITRYSGGALVAFLAAGTLLTIGNTIRLTIYARRREIGIMRIVGATPGFIRFPFLLEGAFHGVVGALVGGAVLLAAYSSMAAWVVDTIPAFEPWVMNGVGGLLIVYAALVGAGLAFGIIGSWLSIRAYLREP